MALPKYAKDFEPFTEEDYTHMKYCFRCQRKRKAILYADFVIIDRLVKCDPNVSDAQAFDDWVREETEQVEILRIFSSCKKCGSRNVLCDFDSLSDDIFEEYKIRNKE
ncbi:hypothetical protein BIY29_19090 [Brenneria alni]|uniref:Uncharacterized protein n=1 Tax=Brenneria alni TaxID=71656 RepID=A0A421DJ57_9GAMM|nr:hypothetical protein [Brenneria alni]RLM17557.1 hypothetical protein BIY29_19090 [Brenneria alni]